MLSVLTSQSGRLLALAILLASAGSAELRAWTNIGPPGGVNVQEIVVDPFSSSTVFARVALVLDHASPDTIYAGTSQSGVYVTSSGALPRPPRLPRTTPFRPSQ